MRAVTFVEPYKVEVADVPDPVIVEPTDVIIRVVATGVCGSDLHLYHGRLNMDPGFVLGHEYVGEIIEVGSAVAQLAVGDKVLGGFRTACGTCLRCRNGEFHKCQRGRNFGLGSAMGNLPGTQAEMALVPNADVTLRKVPAGLSDASALFAGDVLATGFHGTVGAGLKAGQSVMVVGLGPVGLCAVQSAVAGGAALVIAVDTVADRLEMARRFGATPVHLVDGDLKGVVKQLTGDGVDLAVEAVGNPQALDLTLRMTRPAGTVCVLGVHAERIEVHMGIVFIKALTLLTGESNPIGVMDQILPLLAAGKLDPSPLVTMEMPLADAAEAYARFERRESLKIILRP